MLEYFGRICQVVANHPLVVAVVSNVVLGIVSFLSFWIPRKFVSRELKKVRKAPINEFDKIMILLAGVVFSVVICVVGSEIVSGSVPHQVPSEFVSVVVMFSSLSVLIRSLLDADLVDKSEIPSHLKFYRIAIVSFLIAAAFSVSSVSLPAYVSYGFSLLILVYYFAEIYIDRHAVEKCFTVLRTKEYSIGAKLVDFINRKFVFIVLTGMVSIPLINQKCGVPAETFLYCNILDMVGVLIGMFVLQVFSSAFVNRFIKKLDELEKGKSSRKSAQSRKKNLLWICDVLAVFGYLSVVLALLWLVGINVQKYIFHDTIFTVALIVFGTVLLYNAFKEFTDAFVDRSNPIDHEKILTFMPIITIIFNFALFFVAGLSVLSQLGVAIGPLLASFAAVGATVALAAKDILKGFLQGIILLFENNFYMGDFITINGKSGIVVKISTRTLTLRDFNGDEYAIPYDTISVITNHSREFYVHYENLLVSPNADVKKASELLIQVVNQLKSEAEYSDKIFGDVHISGIKTFSDDGIYISWSLKTSTSARLLHLEIYKRLLPLLQEAKIRVPYKQEYIEHILLSDG
ncbi:MAG: mechanosensitive ion channel [Alphaproteobacteria bacterium]|nr:mechanosensitive ion channel [Alphaproteobacteria bacterium]